jgi:hypothetical protein
MDGKLYAFADDIVLIFDSEITLRWQMEAMESLKDIYKLKLHPKKSQYMHSGKLFKTKLKIKGYSKVTKYKYLGFTISNSKQSIIRDAKLSIKKNLYSIKNRISSQSQNVARAMSNAFINSLLIYHMTPLFGANLISKDEIDKYETYLKKT